MTFDINLTASRFLVSLVQHASPFGCERNTDTQTGCYSIHTDRAWPSFSEKRAT